ncbi:hypothetical protein ABN148_20065 [Klebsiella oxytoca]|uniref:hypothetical protein n=1 Tax=Klebsiella oxytoca TaxID=571 RepID=UPI0032DA0C30
MTSKLTIEQAKRLRNDFECWQQDYDPKDDKEQYDMFGRGMAAMDMLIAGMYQEPVAWRVSFTQIGHESNNFTKTYWDEEEKDRWVKLHKMSGFKVNVEPLYTAPPVLAALDSEPVAYTDERNLGYIDRGRETAYLWGKQNSEAGDVPLYRHAQQPVVDADDNFYSWFGREWQENYQHNQYTTAAKQMLGVMAESAWIAATERQRQKQSVSVPDVKIYEDVPYEVGRFKTHRDCYCDGWNACRAAMLNGGKS